MEGKTTVVGLKEAMKAMQAAFPDDIKQQARIVNGAMGGAARKTILPAAKSMALAGDGSGALSESLGVRAQKARMRRGKAGGMQVVPVRDNKKAMAKYIAHYYTAQGKTPPAGILASGIRHGHLVEFGVPGRGISAQPFMWPAAKTTGGAYLSLVGSEMKKRIESAVKRKAKKAKR